MKISTARPCGLGKKYLMAAFAISASFSLINVAGAATPIRAQEGASFRGEINANGQKFVCWKGFAANSIGDFGARAWLHPFKDNATITDGCTPLFGDGSLNLYRMSDLNNPATRQALLVATTPPNGDGLDSKLGANICRMDDPAGNGSKLLVTANPNSDARCVK